MFQLKMSGRTYKHGFSHETGKDKNATPDKGLPTDTGAGGRGSQARFNAITVCDAEKRFFHSFAYLLTGHNKVSISAPFLPRRQGQGDDTEPTLDQHWGPHPDSLLGTATPGTEQVYSVVLRLLLRDEQRGI